MSDIAIRVENLSKLYRIGQRERYATLRDTLARSITAPFRLLRRETKKRGKGETGQEKFSDSPFHRFSDSPEGRGGNP